MTSNITPITAASNGGTTPAPRTSSPATRPDHACGEAVYHGCAAEYSRGPAWPST